MRTINLNEKEMDKYLDSLSEAKIVCKKCGHKVTFGRKDRVICSWCGHWIYKDDKTEYKYKIQELRRKMK